MKRAHERRQGHGVNTTCLEVQATSDAQASIGPAVSSTALSRYRRRWAGFPASVASLRQATELLHTGAAGARRNRRRRPGVYPLRWEAAIQTGRPAAMQHIRPFLNQSPAGSRITHFDHQVAEGPASRGRQQHRPTLEWRSAACGARLDQYSAAHHSIVSLDGTGAWRLSSDGPIAGPVSGKADRTESTPHHRSVYRDKYGDAQAISTRARRLVEPGHAAVQGTFRPSHGYAFRRPFSRYRASTESQSCSVIPRIHPGEIPKRGWIKPSDFRRRWV